MLTTSTSPPARPRRDRPPAESLPEHQAGRGERDTTRRPPGTRSASAPPARCPGTRSGVTPAASSTTQRTSHTASSGISGRPGGGAGPAASRRTRRPCGAPTARTGRWRTRRRGRTPASPGTPRSAGGTTARCSSTPCGWMPSGSTATIVQCPSTTTVMAAARRKSMTRCRVAGVAAATVRTVARSMRPAWRDIRCAVVSTRAPQRQQQHGRGPSTLVRSVARTRSHRVVVADHPRRPRADGIECSIVRVDRGAPRLAQSTGAHSGGKLNESAARRRGRSRSRPGAVEQDDLADGHPSPA